MNRWAYFRAFLGSAPHAWLALATLGLGLASATGLGLVVGGTLYVLGLLYGPEWPAFRRRVDRARLAREEEARHQRLQTERDDLFRALPEDSRRRYLALVGICREIEAQFQTLGLDPYPLVKLDHLMLTGLRFLQAEVGLREFLEAEEADLAGQPAEAEDRLARARSEAESDGSVSAGEERLLESLREGRDTVLRRREKLIQTRQNREVIGAELERLENQIKLMRAELYASRDVAAFSARIDETTAQIDAANRFVADLARPAGLADDWELPDRRLGYAPVTAPAAGSVMRPSPGRPAQRQ